MTLSDVKIFDGRKIPSKMTMKPLDKEGSKTAVIYNFLKLNAKVDKDTFTLRNLKKPFN